MNDASKEERIRLRAHEIWERGGRREGQQERDWEQARREIESEDEDTAGLQATLTETIGLAAGVEPEGSRQPSEPEATEAVKRRGAREKP